MFFKKYKSEEIKPLENKIDKVLVRQKNNYLKFMAEKKKLEDRMESLSVALLTLLATLNSLAQAIEEGDDDENV